MQYMLYELKRTKKNHSLQVTLTEYLIEMMIYVKCVDPGDDSQVEAWPSVAQFNISSSVDFTLKMCICGDRRDYTGTFRLKGHYVDFAELLY